MPRVEVKTSGVRSPSAGYGCTRPLAGIGCVCILLGSLAISRWDDLYLVARVGAIILIVFGVICVMPMLGLWTLRLWVERFTKKLFVRVNEMNSGETQRNQARYAGDLEYRPATDSDMQGSEREVYERSTSSFLELGCQLLGDIVNVKSVPESEDAVVLRTMSSTDGKSWLIIRREVPIDSDAWKDDPRLTVEIISEFLDGTFCCTTNSNAISPRTLPPQLRMDSCPPQMPVAENMLRHDASLRMLTSSEAMTFTTLAEVLGSQQRKYALSAGFKAMLALNDSSPT